MNATEKAIEVLEVTASNIRSLGPAGALDPYVPYRDWLAAVESALDAMQNESECIYPKCGRRHGPKAIPGNF